MIQIIGWLLCVYLVVKGFELLAMKQTLAYVGAALAFIAAPVFVILLNAQVEAQQPPLKSLGQYAPSGAPVDDLDAIANNAIGSAEADELERQADALRAEGERLERTIGEGN